MKEGTSVLKVTDLEKFPEQMVFLPHPVMETGNTVMVPLQKLY